MSTSEQVYSNIREDLIAIIESSIGDEYEGKILDYYTGSDFDEESVSKAAGNQQKTLEYTKQDILDNLNAIIVDLVQDYGYVNPDKELYDDLYQYGKKDVTRIINEKGPKIIDDIKISQTDETELFESRPIRIKRVEL